MKFGFECAKTVVSFESMICETELCILILKGNVE